MSEPKTNKKIAILGGGLGSLITAAELSGGKNAGKYDITVYQHGWRLGGKGASGRNAKFSQRIEEHGLHIWFGCYDNAFTLFRPLLAEWKLPAGHPWDAAEPKDRWRHAFKPASFSVVVERRNGGWEPWEFDMPIRDNGEPGDGTQHFDGLWTMLHALVSALLGVADVEHRGYRHRFCERKPLNDFLGALRTLVKLPLRVAQLIYALMTWMRTILTLLGSGDPLHKIAVLIDLGLAIAKGLVLNWWKISRHTLDALDDMELRAFLEKYGAARESLNSPVLGSIYAAVFAQVGGDPTKDDFAAGAALRSMLRILIGYKHAMFYKMQAGMGDTVFTPLYEVLRARGVKFKLFHRVRSVELSADKKSIARVKIGRQVTLAPGCAEYEPIVTVNGLGCWPSEPQWSQIDPTEAADIQAKGHNLEHAENTWADRQLITLHQRAQGEADSDLVFDHVVLGISLGGLPSVCPELIEANPKFKDMVEHVKTVRTEACQMWLKTDLAGLGWDKQPPVFGRFVDPLNTWADMSHLLEREEIDPADRIGNVAYLCGPMPDTVNPGDAAAHLQQSVDATTNELANTFWPLTNQGGIFNCSLVAMEYRRWNVTPSDRYVLSVAGSTKHRLRPDESGFANLTLAGDWTRNGWNVGCVEATVMSGRLAAHAISGYPKRREIAYVDGP